MAIFTSISALRFNLTLCIFLLTCCLILSNIAYSKDENIEEVAVDDHIKAGLKYEISGDLERAFKEFKEAIKKDSSDYRGHFGIANIQQKLGDFLKAEDNFERAIELAPKSSKPMIHNNLAWLYIETNRPVLAEALIRDIMDDDLERNYIYLDTLASAYSKMDNIIFAKDYYTQALMFVPLTDIPIQLSIYSHIRDMYLRIGNEDMVLKLDEVLKKLELGHPATINDLGLGGLE